MNLVPLGEFMPARIPSVNPAKHVDELFELWSIPAFDVGTPEVLRGGDIGSSKKCVEPGDVLLSRIVPHIRRSWVVRPSTSNRQIASGEWITFRGAAFDPDYLRHILTSDPFHAEFMQTVAGVGGSLLRARPDSVKQIKIPLPPLDEQKRIARVLDQAAELCRLRSRALEKLNTLGQAIFHEMFGDPVANAMGLPRTSLAECANFQSGATPSKKEPDYWDGDVPWITPKDMKKTWLDGAQDHVSQAALSLTNLKLVRAGTPLIVVRGMILAHTVPLGVAEVDCTINQDMKAISFDKRVNPVFGLYNLMCQHANLLSRVSTAAHGTKRFDMSELGKTPILLPALADQERFVGALMESRRIRRNAENDAVKQKALFASLQHRAFRGEL